jgi:DNA-binding GntR family transcriptional regulator
MAKPNILQKRAANLILDKLSNMEWRAPLVSENEMARQIDVSRTTVRGALRHLTELGVLGGPGGNLKIIRRPRKSDYFSRTQTTGPRELIERAFMQRMLLGDWQPGQRVSETDLARDSGAGAASVREYLIAFSRYHLIEKQPRGGWRLRALDADFVNEVADMRALVETAAIDRFPKAQDAAWLEKVTELIRAHETLIETFEDNYLSFASLDRDFHLWLIGHLHNRFARDLYDIISFVFHYHYQYSKSDERERNRVAVDEHLRILNALRSGDIDAARSRLTEHLATSRASFMRSVRNTVAGPKPTRRRAPRPRLERGEHC